MPLEPDVIRAPVKTTLVAALEPVQNNINSLLLLNRAEQLSGFGKWVTDTSSQLSAEQRRLNRIVFVGLYYVVEPDRSWPSFEAYIDDLAQQSSATMRDRILSTYAQIIPLSQRSAKDEMWQTNPMESADLDRIIATQDGFVQYLRERFPADHIEPEIEAEAYRLLKNPATMQKLIVSHLRTMWDKYLSAEWKQAQPMLQACVDAFQQIKLGELSAVEATRRVLGREPEEWLTKSINRAGQVIFVPSAHLGPYLGRFQADETLWLLFGARLPQGAQTASPDLTRSELLVRLQALSDDTRLRMLHLLSQKGEHCSPDIMSALDLSQSAASRHLQQLSAVGYITERRREGAKCYELNQDRIDDTCKALSKFLSKSK
jgi:DNA-binding transcriptional ArsR family regulator